MHDNEKYTYQVVSKEVAIKQFLGPYSTPPLPNLFYSPLNLVPKAGNPGEFRLIHNLAEPHNGTSINDCIPGKAAEVQCTPFDDVVHLANFHSTSAWAAHMDIASTFHNLPIYKDDLSVLAVTLQNKIYINSAVTFGSHSSCQLFEKFATLLNWILNNHALRNTSSHYLDDFFLIKCSEERLLALMSIFSKTCEQIGIPLAHEKTLGPAQQIDYLGLRLDLINQTIGIPGEKLTKASLHIEKLWKQAECHSNATVQEIQKPAGLLQFLCKAVPAGRPFL